MFNNSSVNTQIAIHLLNGTDAPTELLEKAVSRNWRFRETKIENGNGTCKYTDGAVYSGEWKNGVLINGEITRRGGIVAKGSFEEFPIDNNMTSTYITRGKLITEDGVQFEGNFYGGHLKNGRIIYSNGESHIGTFAEDVLDGNGEKRDEHGRLTEKGVFDCGVLALGVLYAWDDDGVCDKIIIGGNKLPSHSNEEDEEQFDIGESDFEFDEMSEDEE